MDFVVKAYFWACSDLGATPGREKELFAHNDNKNSTIKSNDESLVHFAHSKLSLEPLLRNLIVTEQPD